jgi:hypothetical protein
MCCLVSSRAFRQSPICRHYSGVRNIMHIGALCSLKQKISSTTPQHNRKHNRAPCPTAPSAHASYKGYGFNNAKPPRASHRNTMMDVVVLGCGLIRTGKRAVAQFIGVHILGEIRPAEGENQPWDGTAALFVATDIKGNIQCLGGGGRHGQLVTGRSISMAPPTRTS